MESRAPAVVAAVLEAGSATEMIWLRKLEECAGKLGKGWESVLGGGALGRLRHRSHEDAWIHAAVYAGWRRV